MWGQGDEVGTDSNRLGLGFHVPLPAPWTMKHTHTHTHAYTHTSNGVFIFNHFILATLIFLIDPFWRFLATACSSNSSRLARLKKGKRLLCWRLLRCGFGAGEWGARAAGAPPGGRGASIFLGGSDPFLPKIFV